MAFWTLALTGLGAVLTLMTIGWLASLYYRDASLVDRFWGLTFIVYGLTYALLSDGYLGRRILMATLVTIWGLRLALFITWRNWGHGEDKRYQAMRRNKPDTFPARSLFTIFWGQGLLAWVIALPLLGAAFAANPDRITALDILGVLVWSVGLYFEAVGDLQLSRFLADDANKGTVMDRGLWAYTRHPNYFGDTVVWWGLFTIALATGAIWAAVGSAVMTLFIVRVSGVALTDRNMAQGGNRGGTKRVGYDEYVRRTNAFIPGPPKP